VSFFKKLLILFEIILLFVLGIVIDGGVLVLLVLRDEIVHVRLGFGELHFVHTFASVPVKEGLTTEHSSELFRDTLEEFLDGGRVTDEGTRHLESTWWDVADGNLDVVWDPFNEVRGVLVLDVEHLFVNFLHGHTTTEDGSDGEVTSVTWVASGHHVLGVEQLLGELGNRQGTVLLGSSAGEWGETGDEEVETWEWDHVDGELSEVRVELTWESEASGDTGHGGGDEVVEVTVCWGCELQCSEADVVEGFVVNDEGFVSVFDELMDGECGVVWFDNGVGNLW